MSLFRWRTALGRTSGDARRGRRPSFPRPALEELERRTLLTVASTFVDDNWNLAVDTAPFGVLNVGDVVNNTNDTVNPGTIVKTYGVDGFGTVTTGSATGSVSGSAKIADAVANTSAGGTVNLLQGTYQESDILLNKALTVQGIGATNNDVRIVPSVADGHAVNTALFDPGSHNALEVRSSNVTVKDLTVDGDGGVGGTGSRNFRGGVATNYNIGSFSNLTATNLQLKNLWTVGVYFDGGFGTLSSGNLANNNQVNQVLGDFKPTGIEFFQASGSILGNTITNVEAGIGTNNQDPTVASLVPVVTIKGNQISQLIGVGPSGINVAALGDGSVIGGTAAGEPNVINLTGNATADIGIIVQYAAGQVTVRNNTITGTGGDAGIWLYHDTDPAKPVIVQGNALTATSSVFGSGATAGQGVGVFLTDNGALVSDDGNTGAAYGSILGNTINGFAVGSYLNAANAALVVLTAGGTVPADLNTITGATTGVLVEGSNATFQGTGGVTGSVSLIMSGHIAPGVGGPGVLSTGSLTGSAGTTFDVQLVSAAAAGLGYDQIKVTGSVNLNGSTLNLTSAFTPAPNTTFTLIDNDGSDAVVGTFNGLPQGGTLSVGNVVYQISYTGGTGNDVVLTATNFASSVPFSTLFDFNGDGIADLWLFTLKGTSSGQTEIRILDGATNFQTFLLVAVTGLFQTDLSRINFEIGDYNGDGRPDVWCIVKNGTATNSTEIHILSGATNFSTFILDTGTVLEQTDNTWQFQVIDFNRDGRLDVVGFKQSSTGSGSTEVHILNGSTNFQTFATHVATGLAQTGAEAYLRLADYNRDGVLDLVYIKKFNTDSSKTEVHVLNGVGNFQTFLLHVASVQHPIFAEGDVAVLDFNRDGFVDFAYIKKNMTQSNKIEVHVVNGQDNYQSYLLHVASIHPAVPNNPPGPLAPQSRRPPLGIVGGLLGGLLGGDHGDGHGRDKRK